MICIIHTEHDPLYSLRRIPAVWRAGAAKQLLGRICGSDEEGAARNEKACAASTNRTHSTAMEKEEEMKRLFAISVIVVLPLAFAFGLAAGEKKEVSFPGDWRSYTHVKSMVIPDKNHGLYGFHHVYINGKGLATLKGGGAYPEGSIFIVVFYDVNTEKDGSITQGKKMRYVYMRKDASAKETGDWEYAVFDADGKFVEKDPKKCYECHTGVKNADFVFSKFIE